MSLPFAEVCVLGETGYDWHYASPLGPLTASIHPGYGVNRQLFSRGIVSPVSPLFNKLQLSIATVLTPNDSEEPSIISSPLYSVYVYYYLSKII